MKLNFLRGYRLFGLMAFAFLVRNSSAQASPDCDMCRKYAGEWIALNKQHEKLSQLLSMNKELFQKISTEAASQRIKISSNLVVLSARVEAASNNRSSKLDEFKKAGCPQCPKSTLTAK
ncbi:hypothetical protein WDW37_12425 [Bdellovibrionota bacterium FG-1]